MSDIFILGGDGGRGEWVVAEDKGGDTRRVKLLLVTFKGDATLNEFMSKILLYCKVV